MDAAINPAEAGGPEHMVTLRVPDLLYERVQQAAEALKRSLEDVVLLALATALPPLPELPRDVADDLGTLAFLDDAALLDVARSAWPPELGAEMDALLADKGRGELGTEAGQRLDELVRAHEVLMLRRAQAALLLQRRGHDMSDPAKLTRVP